MVQVAALNNAHLYAGVCQAHGISYRQTEDVFEVLGSPPRYYANLVTLRKEARPIPGQHPWGMKDSFCDCTPEGCEQLFEANWICATGTSGKLNLDWKWVRTEEALRLWLQGWSEGDAGATNFPPQFPDSMLEDQEFRFMLALVAGQIVAGCLLNWGGGAIGLSNTFGSPLLYKDARTLSYDWNRGLPMVGYERGDSLACALQAGFNDVGPLRIWIKKA